MSKKLSSLFAALMLFALLLSACSSPAPAPVQAALVAPVEAAAPANNTVDTELADAVTEVAAPAVTEVVPPAENPYETCDPEITGCPGSVAYAEEDPATGFQDVWFQETYTDEGVAIPVAGGGIDPSLKQYASCMDAVQNIYVGQPEPSRQGIDWAILPNMAWDSALGGWIADLGNGAWQGIFPGKVIQAELATGRQTSQFDQVMVQKVRDAIANTPCANGPK